MKEYTLKTPVAGNLLKIDYASELNAEQYQAVIQGDGPCLVLAGAGSGKTRVLVYRVAYLLEHGVGPNRILLVTFTNKAAKEMLSRIGNLLQTEAKGLWGGTFHHIGNRLLRTYGEAIGLKNNFNILDSDDSRALLKSCYRSLRLPEDKYFPKADLIHKIISLAANLNQPVAAVIGQRFSHLDERYWPLINEIAQKYQQNKAQNNFLDFDDLLIKWLELLQKEKIKEKLTSQFQYILVDEYQDTNPVQGEIVANLAGHKQNVLVVGDDSQSIYSFRGADVNNILNFPKIFPKCHTFKLETNYRSTPEILTLANKSIGHNQRQFKKVLRTHKSSGSRPALVPLVDNYLQAEFVCQRILDLQREDGLSLNGLAVLFRAHYQSLELEMEFNKRNLPYVMRGGLRFFEQAHLKDVLAYFKVLANIRDELSWKRILEHQAGIGGAISEKIWRRVLSFDNLAEILSFPFDQEFGGQAIVGWKKVVLVLKRLAQSDTNQVAALVEAVINSDYDNYLKSNYENYADRRADLEQLAIFSQSYDSLEKFLSDVALSEGFKSEVTKGQSVSENEAVTLSTIHQAKGLEWPVVFIIGLAEGQFPNLRSLANKRDLEEERRLFYVAATRAQDQLYLTYPSFGREMGVIGRPSPFIQELPKDVYEDWQVKAEIADEEIIYVDENGVDDVAAKFWQRMRQRISHDKNKKTNRR